MILWIAAVIAHGSWEFGRQYLSVLGCSGLAAILFNSGVIVAGLLAIPYAVGLRRALGGFTAATVGMFTMIVASIGLVGVGVFPMTVGTPHTVAAFTFFGFILLSLIVLAWPIIHTPEFRIVGGSVTVGGLVVVIVSLPLTPPPLLEAITVLVVVVWSVVMSVRMLQLQRLPKGNQGAADPIP